MQLMASVTSGVQSTGTSLWPLLVFLGIGIAFVIAVFVVNFIRHALASRSGYYHMRGPGDNHLVRDKDQALGKAVYEVQEYGMTEF